MSHSGEAISERLTADVSAVLRRHDPLGVISSGAPEDEYMPEARDLAVVIEQGKLITAETVAGVWLKWFGSGNELPGHQVAAIAADLRSLHSGTMSGPVHVARDTGV